MDNHDLQHLDRMASSLREQAEALLRVANGMEAYTEARLGQVRRYHTHQQETCSPADEFVEADFLHYQGRI